MKKAELEKLIKRRDEILAQLARDSDPSTWPEMNDRQGRGDRLYVQRNLEASARLVEQLNKLIAQHEETDRAERMGKIEKEAEQLSREAEERMVQAYGPNWRETYGGHRTKAAEGEQSADEGLAANEQSNSTEGIE